MERSLMSAYHGFDGLLSLNRTIESSFGSMKNGPVLFFSSPSETKYTGPMRSVLTSVTCSVPTHFDKMFFAEFSG